MTENEGQERTCSVCSGPLPEGKEICSTACEERVWPTRWTTTQPGQSYMIEAQDLEPALVPGQRTTGFVTNDDGERIELSVPHAYYEKWIDPAGNVRAVPMKSCRPLKKNGQFEDQGPYHAEIRESLYRAGFLHYETGGRGETKESFLPRRDREIAKRRAKQAKYMARADEKHNAAVNAKGSQLKKDLTEAMVEIADNLAKKAKAKETR